jgi:hypothetical protein
MLLPWLAQSRLKVLATHWGQISCSGGRKGRQALTVTQKCQERSVLNKVDKLLKLRLFYCL